MLKRAEIYIKAAEENAVTPSVAGLCRSMGISRERLAELKENPDCAAAITEALLAIEEALCQRLMDKSTSAGAVFMLKNDFGWSDRPRQTEQADEDLALLDDDELASRLRQALGSQ